MVTEIKFLGYFWRPRFDLVSLDPVCWATVEKQLRTLMNLLVSGRANADSLRSVTGILVWAAKVIPGGKVSVTRGLYQVIRLVKATSLSAALARKIIIQDRALMQTALDDLSWWLSLCVAFRLWAAHAPPGYRSLALPTRRYGQRLNAPSFSTVTHLRKESVGF